MVTAAHKEQHMKGQACVCPPAPPSRHGNHSGFILTLLWWAPTLLILSLADNYVFYLARFYSWHILKSIINHGAASPPHPPPLAGAASICIYVYLQYLEIVFVSGSM